MEIPWIDGAQIRVRAEDGTLIVSANREGLLSLAEQLNILAEQKVYSHIHYDEENSLEDGSCEWIVEKIP